MANKKYLDNVGLDHTWGKIKAYLTNNYAAKSHTHTANQITDLDAELGVNLIEKRVVTTSGAVSIPVGTRAIAYVGIGGGGGGGGGDIFVAGGGGGSGASGDATGGSGATLKNDRNGGNGGKGEIGFLYNFVGLSISAVIGAGGAGGAGGSSGGAGGNGGNSYVNVSSSSTIPISIFPGRTTLNRNGNGGNGSTGGAALSVLGTAAGAGGNGGGRGQRGFVGGKGAIIFLFYS